MTSSALEPRAWRKDEYPDWRGLAFSAHSNEVGGSIRPSGQDDVVEPMELRRGGASGEASALRC
jgi:hypothetical protein